MIETLLVILTSTVIICVVVICRLEREMIELNLKNERMQVELAAKKKELGNAKLRSYSRNAHEAILQKSKTDFSRKFLSYVSSQGFNV